MLRLSIAAEQFSASPAPERRIFWMAKLADLAIGRLASTGAPVARVG